jgi:hypothetical protein
MESSASAGRVASAVLDPRRWWALALVRLVYAVVEAPGADWADVGTILPLAGSAVLVAALASNTALQTGTALGVAIVTTVAVSRSQHYLAAHLGANPLAAHTEHYPSAFLACAVLAGIGLALALVLPGRPRKPAHELPEPDPAAMPLPQRTW